MPTDVMVALIGLGAVSYTHLDVYKRQILEQGKGTWPWGYRDKES